MVSPGKPSPGKSVPPLSDHQVQRLSAAHTLIDPTRYLVGSKAQKVSHELPAVLRSRTEKHDEVNEQNPKATHRLLDAASFVIKTRAKVKAWGLENVPEDGIYIAAATHVTQFDVFIPMMTMFHLGRRPRFMAKEELGSWPFVGWALKQVGMQSVPRRKGQARAIEEESLRILANGRPLTIWPEGTVTRDPQKWPMSLKRGTAEIALLASRNAGHQVPLLPMVTWGAASINHFWPWPRKNVVMAVDAPLDYDDLLADAATWGEEPPVEAVTALSERIRRRMEVVMEEIRGEKAPSEGMWDYRSMTRVPRP